MNDPVLQSPDLLLSGDSTRTINFQKNPMNIVTQLFGAQLPAIRNGFFNVQLSQGVIIQPHYHTNVTEMVFVIRGEVMTSVFNPFTRQAMIYRVGPGQVSIFPKGWFHWIVAMSDQAHFLTIFDQPTPDIVFGSDFLSSIPGEVMNRAYCLNAEEYDRTVAPLVGKAPEILGPPSYCHESHETAFATALGGWTGNSGSAVGSRQMEAEGGYKAYSGWYSG
jgi:quercetin dioxygenase-like cupin family protein